MPDETRRSDLQRLAVNPETGRVDLVLTLDYDRVNATLNHRDSLGDKMTLAYIVPEALKKPTALYQGLRFEEDERHSCSSPGWLCYCYYPEFKYNLAGQKVKPPVDKVFLVFVNEDKEVYNWAWVPADLDALTQRKHLPQDYQTRFEKPIF